MALMCVLTPAASPRDVGAAALHYTVCLDRFPGSTLEVSLEIAGWAADTLLLHGVPIYVDNPTAAADTQVVWKLTATKPDGEKLVIDAGEPDEFGQVAHTVRGCRGDRSRW